MGVASSTFRFYFRDESPLILVEELLRCFESQFCQPKSMEIRLPGRRIEKVEGSVDGNLLWGRDALPSRLPGEKIIDGSDFTTLENPAEWLTISRDISRIIGRLRTYSEDSAQLWKTKQTLDDDVVLIFWGLCRLASVGQESKEGDVLRQQLYQDKRLAPILRVICHLCHHPRPYLMTSLLIHSFVWSRHTCVFDASSSKWGVKSELSAESKNARRLAETISDCVRLHPYAEFEWEMEQEHTPDLRGILPTEFETRFGPPNRPKRAKDLVIK